MKRSPERSVSTAEPNDSYWMDMKPNSWESAVPPQRRWKGGIDGWKELQEKLTIKRPDNSLLTVDSLGFLYTLSEREISLTFSLHLWPSKFLISCPSQRQKNGHSDLQRTLAHPRAFTILPLAQLSSAESTKNRGLLCHSSLKTTDSQGWKGQMLPVPSGAAHRC